MHGACALHFPHCACAPWLPGSAQMPHNVGVVSALLLPPADMAHSRELAPQPASTANPQARMAPVNGAWTTAREGAASTASAQGCRNRASNCWSQRHTAAGANLRPSGSSIMCTLTDHDHEYHERIARLVSDRMASMRALVPHRRQIGACCGVDRCRTPGCERGTSRQLFPPSGRQYLAEAVRPGGEPTVPWISG